MRRLAVSMPSNIAEGYGRQYQREYKQYLSIAYGSSCEFETQYFLAIDLGFIQRSDTVNQLIKEIGAMLYRMVNPQR